MGRVDSRGRPGADRSGPGCSWRPWGSTRRTQRAPPADTASRRAGKLPGIRRAVRVRARGRGGPRLEQASVRSAARAMGAATVQRGRRIPLPRRSRAPAPGPDRARRRRTLNLGGRPRRTPYRRLASRPAQHLSAWTGQPRLSGSVLPIVGSPVPSREICHCMGSTTHALTDAPPTVAGLNRMS